MAAGDEKAPITDRIGRYRDAGVTEFAARVVPLGADPVARTASRKRTQEFIADISAEF